jgi:type II secretory pathway pseudopilin PulG
MSYRNKKYRGFLLTELMVSLVVLGFILTCLALSLNGFRKFNHYQLVRQRCISAAQAELDCIATTGREISEEDFKRLWPSLSISVEKTAGTGQWEGLELVSVKTKANSFNNNVEVELSRYISGETRR